MRKKREATVRRTPTGTFMKNIQFQPMCSVIHPPREGPTAGAKEAPRPNIPMATPFLSGGYMEKRMAWAETMIKASANPWTDLNRIIW